MQGVPQSFDSPADQAEFRPAGHRPGVELYRAHIVRHVFAPHTHDAYGFGAIEHGVERFRCRGSDHLAPPDSLVLMNPDVLHTGRAETAGGWRYRMIYLTPQVLAEVSGEDGWWFDQTVVDSDRPRAQRVSRLLQTLWATTDPLTSDGLLHQLVMELRPLARRRPTGHDGAAPRFAAVLDHMNDHLADRLTLDDLARVAGLSPFHFLRQFQRQHHVSPHQMLMARRLVSAKQRLAAGMAPAEVAAATGLCDQSHLNKAFVRRYGVTPARYQRQVRG